MSVRVAVVLGISIVLAALVHGGIYAPGQDFVVNRFTGWFTFVPSEDEEWEDEDGVSGARGCALTSRRPPDRFGALHRRR